ncbi:IS3 family transposase, partial [Kitasatospora sp. NPDC017646]
GYRKVWAELQRRGHTVAQCTVSRLMKAEGLSEDVKSVSGNDLVQVG